jgi:hypothetical protein
MVHILGVISLSVLPKPLGDIQPIILGEALYRLVNRVLFLQFHDMFSFHMLLHQFNVVIKGGFKALVHGILSCFG